MVCRGCRLCTFLLCVQKKRCQKKSRRLCLPGYSLLARAERHANSLPAASSDRCRSPRPRCVVRFTPLRLGRVDGLPAGADRAEKGAARRGTSLLPAARQGHPDISLPPSVVHFSFVRALFFCAYKRKDAKRKAAGCASRATPSLLGLSGTNSPPAAAQTVRRSPTPSLRRPFHAREPRPEDGLTAGESMKSE